MFNTTKETLIGAQIPTQTRTYKPVSHEQLIDLTLNGVEKAGFKINKETYTSAQEGQIANARYSIQNVADNEMSLEIGWQNSYNKTLSLKFAIGAHIFICSNGMVRGDMGTFKKKHMSDVQEFTPANIQEYIKRAGDHFTLLQRDRDAMKQVEITKRTSAELIGRMFIEEDFIKSTQLMILSREMETPTHDYNSPNSVWEFYNNVTFSMKSLHPSLWMENHIKLHDFIINESGLLTSSSNMVETIECFEVM